MLVEIFSHADFAKLIRCVVQHKFAWFESEERRHEIHLQQNITIHIEYVYNVSQLELYTYITYTSARAVYIFHCLNHLAVPLFSPICSKKPFIVWFTQSLMMEKGSPKYAPYPNSKTSVGWLTNNTGFLCWKQLWTFPEVCSERDSSKCTEI